VLANYYRNERDSMGMHADDEPELGEEPTIVSMSFGATRTFVLKHKSRRDVPIVRLPLLSESILVMKGATQKHWLHGIEKKTRAHGPRINLTFRYIQTL
jgi:alkylated DNA repair dioxygenase AlkB